MESNPKIPFLKFEGAMLAGSSFFWSSLSFDPPPFSFQTLTALGFDQINFVCFETVAANLFLELNRFWKIRVEGQLKLYLRLFFKGQRQQKWKVENELQKTIDGLKQELEVAHGEVAELSQKLTITNEEKEELNSKYVAALSKIQEADKINMDLKTDAEALGIQRSKLLVENAELTKQLDIAERDSSPTIDEEKKITDGLRTLVDQLKDEKLALGKELQAVTGELSVLKQQLEHAEQQITNISNNLKVTEEENESLKEKLDEREREVHQPSLRCMKGIRMNPQIKSGELKAQITNLELELESLQNQKKDVEEQIKISTTEARELGEPQFRATEPNFRT
ncbi:putative myosin-9 [Sesbania bispinosa]|nr:putative myosin-9 [Sesbania bispinosa]